MAWNKDIALYLNTSTTAGSPLIASKVNPTPAPIPEWIAGDARGVRFWLRELTGNQAEPLQGVRLEPGTWAVVLAGKALSGLAGSTLLYSATEFAEVEDGADYYYQSALNLNTDELVAAMGALGSANVLQTICDLEVQNLENTQRFTFQFQVNIRRQAYAGEGDPTPAAPPYPLPEALVVKEVAGKYRITAEGLFLWNTDQEAWHELLVRGAAGEEYLAIVEAEE
jgi:hypothetical protein